MPDPELAEAWFASASRDLEGARAMAEQALGDLAVYHAQQCAEKAVKGLLAFHEQTIEKTHAIHTLIQALAPLEPRLTNWLTAATALTDWGHDYRYPEDGLLRLPDAQTVQTAIQYATEIFGTAKSLVTLAEDA
jgi:HEPN domain-containing protein